LAYIDTLSQIDRAREALEDVRDLETLYAATILPGSGVNEPAAICAQTKDRSPSALCFSVQVSHP
jgi:hypothetical protein